MSYEVTATRRRPRVFDELIGQEFVVGTLKNSLTSGRIAHAYLFAGPRGVGKTSAARILAKALNCPAGPGAEGCENWDGSEDIARGTALDVIEIDGASNTSVNDVRQIKDEVLFAPNSSRYKIYIIDEVHMLSNSAFNALLKTIEEPPPYIVFIFATTEIHKVPATIRSRCQQFNFRLIPLEKIRELLSDTVKELGVTAEEDALGWIAREATGSLRDAYTLFDQVLAFSDNHISLEMIHEKLGLLGLERLNALMEAVVRQDVQSVLSLTEEAILAGVSVERFTMDLADYLRTVLLIVNGVHRESVIGINSERIPESVRGGFSRDQLEGANELVLQLYRDLRYSVNQRFDLELTLSRLAGLKGRLSPQELVKRIEDLQQELLHVAAHRQRVEGDQDRQDDNGSPGEPGVASDAETETREGADSTSGDADPWDPSSVIFQGISTDEVEQIVARFRTQRISVASLLTRARLWNLSETDLTIGFVDDFGASSLESDREAVQQAAMAVLHRETLRVKIVVGDRRDWLNDEPSVEKPTETPADERVEMVRRVFRGEIMEEDE